MVLDATSKQDGCCELAEAALPRVRKMIECPFNKNSRTWKRLAMRFFPKQSAASQIETYDQAWSEMYAERTLRYAARGQGLLFEA
ncbi:MAG: hypothetical protein ACRD00_01120, partial [Thermoanaerobaculia bacterium]